MTSPLSFNLVVISNGIFAEHKKEGPLNPLRISPRFLVDLQVAGKGGSRQPYFVVVFPGRPWVYGVQGSGGFLLFVLVTLSSSKVGTVGDHGLRPPLWNFVRSFSLQYVRCIFIYIYTIQYCYYIS